MSRRWLVGGIGAIAVVALACGSGREGGAAGPEPIQVGHYASLTGDTATFGQSTDRGLRMKIDEINAAGGVLGRPIEIITEDDRSITEEARSAAQKLLQRDQVVALLGEVASSRSLAAAPEAQRARIPMITPASTNPKVTEVGDYIFRACFIDPFQGAVMAKFARETLGADRVAILFDFKQDYSVGLADFFRKTFEASGGTIVADERYTSGDIEFRAQLTKIRATKPDAIFVPGYYTEVGLIAKQARELGIDVPLLGGDGWDSSKTLEIGGKAVEGNYFSNHYAADSDRPEVVAFVRAYRERWGETPDAMAVLGYDTGGILADAIARAGSTDPEKLRDAIAATRNYPGVSGTISMDENRNARKDAVVMKIRDGAFRYEQTVPAF
ncbi:Leucine-, isoleucine-, valine-, threonine-, and alanine-binding protein [Myxococcaceae bacterium]|nr:Leucine-, isoleucine-, valine-, threonine-, and alanine-binding protein [Myxococcaceae bacterium]